MLEPKTAPNDKLLRNIFLSRLQHGLVKSHRPKPWTVAANDIFIAAIINDIFMTTAAIRNVMSVAVAALFGKLPASLLPFLY